MIYVVQNQHVFDQDAQKLVPKFPDLEYQLRAHAGDKDDIHFLLDPTQSPWKLNNAVQILEDKLGDFSEHDCLVLVGHPLFVAMAMAIAAHVNVGFVRVLQWSGNDTSYKMLDVQFDMPEEYAE